jgi:MOSC domain-containing protein YiiM
MQFRNLAGVSFDVESTTPATLGDVLNLVTVSVGRPREISWQDRVVRTSIFKTPVDGRVRVSRLNLDGDEQSDLLVHGGPDKAVYAYPVEHYAPWQTELALADLPHGSFGENLTVDGLIETEVAIGDEYRIGTAESSSHNRDYRASSWGSGLLDRIL